MKTLPLTLAAILLLAACQKPAADDAATTTEAQADATASYNAAQKGMIPHHVGAVEMAKVALEHGKDPEVRALAEKVIAAQEAEIKEMQAWLDKNGVKAEKPLTAADHAAMGH